MRVLFLTEDTESFSELVLTMGKKQIKLANMFK